MQEAMQEAKNPSPSLSPSPCRCTHARTHPERLDCGERISELVRGLAEHMGLPPTLDDVPVGLQKG